MATSDIIQSMGQNLTNAYASLQTKGATIPQNKNMANLKDSIDSIQTGGGQAVEHGVFFIDYDGSVVEAWDTASVASKTELPSNPTHTGLVAQGWNWSLANIQSYISKYPEADVYVGQMYKTASGLTEIDVSMTRVTGKTITMNMVGNKNWGDGTSDNLTEHTYEDYGDYTITCNGTSIPSGSTSAGGMFSSSYNTVNKDWCTAVRIGENVISIGNYAFNYCYSLRNITIPSSIKAGGSYLFYNCYSLKSIVIPNSTKNIGQYEFSNCKSLTTVSLPSSIEKNINYTFTGCNSLKNITIPENVLTIGVYAFNECDTLDRINIPNNVSEINTYALYHCYSLTKVNITSNITKIGSYAFFGCFANLKYDFSATTAVPTLDNSNSFNNINGNCKIIVPDALYDDWIVATNWSTYADYIYKASEVV